MGSVFRADDGVRGRTVALKALRIDPEMRHREQRIAQFHREYRTLAELAHPRVIQVFDYGVDADGPYYTMELLDGEDLSTCAPMPWQRACLLARDVCSSLALLHSRGYLHRDVSPLNVRCTSDGRAKLIDFGAMVPMGISTLTMGTPSCVAPEALTRSPLDGRVDLFALGATLYFALTERQAYPARDFTQLRAAHARSPLPPSAYASDVPPALDRLVLSLLSLDPMARPRHAAEVMDRLTTLAELGPMEPLAVHQAYLNTPELVGREKALAHIGEHLGRARSSHGVVLRIHGPHGGGRSRVLHAVEMDARLAGMCVVQVEAANAVGPYGVLRALVRELRDASETGAAQLRASPAFLPLLADEVPPDDTTWREPLLRAFPNLWMDLTRGQPFVVAIDDIPLCDEPSLAALLTLASGIRRTALALVFTDDNDPPSEAQRALGLLRELSRDQPLPPLKEAQTEALLGSVFGAVPNLQVLARFVFERAAGNPRATIEVAQAIVDRGLARYELGSWSLPSQLRNDALPASLLEVRRGKLVRLPADAVELAQVIAITEDWPIAPDDVPRLTDHADETRVAEARTALIEARVMTSHDARVLSDRSWQEVVRQSIDASRLRELYARMARVLEARAARPIAIARSWVCAGEVARALDVLSAALSQGTLVEDADPEYPELLQECSEACQLLHRPVRDRFMLARELVALADRVIVKDRGECFRVALEQLRRDSGLADWEVLEESPDRLALALTATQARYDATPAEDRVLAPVDAIRVLVETVYAAAVFAAVVGDMAMLNGLPSLTPFEPLSPAIGAITMAIEAQRALIAARYEDALELYLARLEALQTSAPGLTEAQIARSQLLLRYAVGSLQAGLGIKGSLDHAEQLEGMPGGQVMAAAVRESYCVRRGNTRAADEWRRRMELLQIQHKRPHALKLRQTTQQVECSAHAEDLEETKRNVAVLEELCEIYPAAMPYLHYGRGEYERIRGDYAAGLRHVRLALAMTGPGEHPVWPWAAGCEIDCLRLLGRREEARDVGRERVSQATQVGLRVMRDHIEVFLALVEAELEQFDIASERIDRGIRYREEMGMRGLNLGWSYEARARVAMQMKDRLMFERCLKHCAENYSGGRGNPALAARHEQLLRQARATWDTLELAMPFDHEGASSSSSSMVNSSSLMLSERPSAMRTLSMFKDRDERARSVLTQLLAAANCQSGELYLLDADGLTRAAAIGRPADRSAAARQLLAREDDEASETTASQDEADSEPNPQPDAFSFRPILLTCRRGKAYATVGVLTLEAAAAEPAAFHAAAQELCHALLDLGDVKPKLR